MKKHLKILHSHFWDITFIWDDPMTIGYFHKSFTHFVTIGKTCQWRMDWSLKEPHFSYLPHLGRRYWNRYTMDIWALRNACSKQETLYSGQAFPMIIWETVEKCGICQASSRAAKPVGNVSDVPPHAWYTLGTDLFYWNRIDYLVIGDYFSKYLIVRRLPNSSTNPYIQ